MNVRFRHPSSRRTCGVTEGTGSKGPSAVPECRRGAHPGDVHGSMVLEPIAVEAERASAMFAALSDPARLRILGVLADAGRCVCDIRSEVPIAANLLSYHLRVLREAGLIEARRRGRWIDYRLAADAASLVGTSLRHAGFDATIAEPAGCAERCEAPS